MDKKLLAELRQKHPGEELHRLGGSPELIIVKGPNEAIWNVMQDRVQDPKATAAQKRAAAHNMLVSCVVYPDRDRVVALLEKKPGLLQTFTGQLAEIAGVDNEARAERLSDA